MTYKCSSGGNITKQPSALPFYAHPKPSMMIGSISKCRRVFWIFFHLLIFVRRWLKSSSQSTFGMHPFSQWTHYAELSTAQWEWVINISIPTHHTEVKKKTENSQADTFNFSLISVSRQLEMCMHYNRNRETYRTLHETMCDTANIAMLLCARQRAYEEMYIWTMSTAAVADKYFLKQQKRKQNNNKKHVQ